MLFIYYYVEFNKIDDRGTFLYDTLPSRPLKIYPIFCFADIKYTRIISKLCFANNTCMEQKTSFALYCVSSWKSVQEIVRDKQKISKNFVGKGS